MPVLAKVLSPTGIPLEYHRIVKADVDLTQDFALLGVLSYVNEAAFLSGMPHTYSWQHSIGIADFSGGGGMLEGLEQTLVAKTHLPFFGGQVIADLSKDIETLKQRCRTLINAWWQDANNSYFEFRGERIRYVESDRVSIQGINNIVMLTAAMPVNPDWPSAWKTFNDGWVPIPDLATWVEFNVAIGDRGTAHFKHAQELKAQLDQATTAAEIESITW
jgi:hypothetical protein